MIYYREGEGSDYFNEKSVHFSFRSIGEPAQQPDGTWVWEATISDVDFAQMGETCTVYTIALVGDAKDAYAEQVMVIDFEASAPAK